MPILESQGCSSDKTHVGENGQLCAPSGIRSVSLLARASPVTLMTAMF
ncbi:MAG: hypothetical protein SO440_04685 [Prevotella sp.]|nr:hypothetical protein [Prevotella sp.]